MPAVWKAPWAVVSEHYNQTPDGKLRVEVDLLRYQLIGADDDEGVKRLRGRVKAMHGSRGFVVDLRKVDWSKARAG